METKEATPESVVETAPPPPANRARRKKPARSERKPLQEEPGQEANAGLDLLGISQTDIAREVSRGLLSLGREGDTDGLRSGAAIVRSIQPRTMIEGLLAVQMVAIHLALLRHSRALAKSDTTNDIQLAQSGLNKLARTFALQAETLQRLSDGSTQTIRVERVTVNQGGQAIVGVVSRDGGGQK